MFKRLFFIFALLFFYGGYVEAQAPTTCVVSGVTYSIPGVPRAGVRVRAVRSIVNSQLITLEAVETTSAVDGSWSLIVPRNSITSFCTPGIAIQGISSNCALPTAYTIPNSATVNLVDLMAATAIPTTGMNVFDELVPFINKVSTFKFKGSGVTALETSPGVAEITISGGGGGGASLITRKQDLSLTIDPTSTLEFNQAAGLVLTNPSSEVARLSLSGVPYSALTLTGSVLNADLAGSIANAKLLNSSLTIGSTSVALGATASTIAGLTLTSPTIAKLANLTTNGFVRTSAGDGTLSASALIAGDIPDLSATYSPIAHVHTFASLTSKPTTLLGYGITDAQAAGNYITALTGDGTASGPGSAAFTLATVNGNVGSFGSATQTPTFTVNAKGLITAASQQSIAIAESQVTGLTAALAAKVPTTRTLTAGVGLSGGGDLSANRSFALDLATLVADQTIWNGSQATRTITASLSGATDPILTFGNNLFEVSSNVTLDNNLTVSGGTITFGTGLADASLLIMGTTSAIGFYDGPTQEILFYTPSGDPNLYVRDVPNLRMLATFQRGATVAASNVDLNSAVSIQGILTLGSGPTAVSNAAGVLIPTGGGTGIITYTTGDIIYASASNVLSKLPISTNGFVLKISAGLPVWQAEGGGTSHAMLSATHTDSTAGTVARGDLITGQGASATWTRLAIGAANRVLSSDGTDAAWSTVPNAALANSSITIGSTSVSLGATAATIAGLTLTTPTIASFTNATHTHQNAAGGGTLDGAAIAAGTVVDARLSANVALLNAANVFSINQAVTISDGGTTSTAVGLFITHNTSSTAATGFGAAIDFSLEAATSPNQSAARLSVNWTDGALGTRTSAVTIQTVNLAGAMATTATFAGNGNFTATGAIAGSNLSGTNTGDQTSVTGNAGSATVLQTARNINGVAFNGSADITVTAAAGTLTGATLAANVLATSITSVSTLTGGATGAGFTIALGSSTITGDLPFSNFVQASAASKLAGRGDSGAGDYQEITIGSGLAMTGTTLSATGGGGTVTSVSFTGGLISVATATTTPALTVAGTSGGIPYFSSASAWASSAALAANAIVIGGGAGVAPATTTTGSGVLTALGNTANATGGLTTPDGTATLTNKTISGASNTLSNIANASLTNSSVTITAGAGLTTGGSVALGAAVTVDVGAGTGITVNANDVAINQAFTPTWTGAHIFNTGTTPATVITLDIAAIGSAGSRDSHNILWRGRSDDGTPHLTEWIAVNDVTSNAGASTFYFLSRIDAASFATRMSISDAGTVTATLFSGSGASLTNIPACATCVTSAAALTANQIVYGGGLQAATSSANFTITAAGTLVAIGDSSSTDATLQLNGLNSIVEIKQGSTSEWYLYSPNADANLYVRDRVNARMLATFMPGSGVTNSQVQIGGILLVDGLLKAGSTPVTLTDAAGKILSAALNTVAVANGGTGLTSIAALSIPVANSSNTYTTVTPTAGQSVRINAGGTAWEAFTPGSGGSGTVTTVSVVTANGVSGSVATDTTTPAITLTLGAITPTSVVASGNVTGNNLRATNVLMADNGLTFGIAGVGTFVGEYANGELAIANAAISSVSGLHLGPNTSGFVYLKRNGAGLSIRNGDDTADGTLSVSTLTAKLTDSATTSAASVLDLNHDLSSGTAAAGLGVSWRFLLRDTTTSNVVAGAMNYTWEVATAASHTGKLGFLFVNVGGSTPIERISMTRDGLTIAPGTVATGSPSSALTITGAANTGITASTEKSDIVFNLARTVQFATGALTTQRAALLQAPTYGFVGASTITDAATLAITGAPIAGTNATITNSYALWVQGGTTRLDGNLLMADNNWLGLGSAAGRIEFDDQTIDEINFLNAAVGIGTSTPTNGTLEIQNGSNAKPALWLEGGGSTFSAAARLKTTSDSSHVVFEFQDSSPGQARLAAFNFLNTAGTTLGSFNYFYSTGVYDIRTRSGNAVSLSIDAQGFLNEFNFKRVTSQFDSTSTTLANVTGLTVTVDAGNTYTFRAVLFCTSNVSGGAKAAIGGTATATAITYVGQSTTSVGGGTIASQTSTIGTAVGSQTGAVIQIVIEGTITVNAGGTLTTQFAQSAASGTSSVLPGSTMKVNRIS